MAQLGMALGGGLALGRNGRQAEEAEKLAVCENRRVGRMLVVEFFWGLLGFVGFCCCCCCGCVRVRLFHKKQNQLSGRHGFERKHLRCSLFCDV